MRLTIPTIEIQTWNKDNNDWQSTDILNVHWDDTLYEFQYKLQLSLFNKPDIYLFTTEKRKFDATEFYIAATNNGETEVTHDYFKTFLLNNAFADNTIIAEAAKTANYSYDYFLTLDQQDITADLPITMLKSFGVMYPINPLKSDDTYTAPQPLQTDKWTVNYNTPLLERLPFFLPEDYQAIPYVIYVITSEDLNNNLKWYCTSQVKNKPKDEDLKEKSEGVTTLYSRYSDQAYTEYQHGLFVTDVEILMEPFTFNAELPMDVIFKRLPLNNNYHLIRYKPPYMLQKNVLYRFDPKTLNKATFHTFLKHSFPASELLTVFIQLTIKRVLIFHIYKNGKVKIEYYDKATTITESTTTLVILSDYITTYLNPITEIINTVLLDGGTSFSLARFDTLYTRNLKLIKMSQLFIVRLSATAPKIEMKKLMNPCLESVFALKTAKMRGNLKITDLEYLQFTRGKQLKSDKENNNIIIQFSTHKIKTGIQSYLAVNIQNINHWNYSSSIPMYIISMLCIQNAIICDTRNEQIACPLTLSASPIVALEETDLDQEELATAEQEQEQASAVAEQEQAAVAEQEQAAVAEQELASAIAEQELASAVAEQEQAAVAEPEEELGQYFLPDTTYEDNDFLGGSFGGADDDWKEHFKDEIERINNMPNNSNKEEQKQNLKTGYNNIFTKDQLQQRQKPTWIHTMIKTAVTPEEKDLLYKTKEFNKYQAGQNVIPVVLTNEEKQNTFNLKEFNKINFNTTDYFCPPYYSVRYNIPLTKDQVQSTKYGKVIDKKSEKKDMEMTIIKRTVKPADNSNFNINPVLKRISSTGNCYPICGSSISTKLVDKDTCNNLLRTTSPGTKEVTLPPQSAISALSTSVRKQTNSNTILKITTELSTPGRYGVLPEKFAEMVSGNQCTDKLSADKSCVLRLGVTKSNQTFISCVLELHNAVAKQSNKKNSLADLKTYLSDSVTQDNFNTLQHGALVDLFATEENIFPIEKKLTAALENYKKFLTAEMDVMIDYTFVWDLICKLYNINIIVLKVDENSVTVVCPSDHYFTDVYNEFLPTFIVMKWKDIYNPVVAATTKKIHMLFAGKNDATKSFPATTSTSTTYDQNIALFIQQVVKQQKVQCALTPSTTNYLVYNLTAGAWIKKIQTEKKYNVIEAYTHLNKIVGLGVKKKDEKEKEKDEQVYYIPCLPTAEDLPETIKKKPIQNYNKLSLEATKSFLTQLENVSCEFSRVVKNENAIIGIVTKAESFIPVIKSISSSSSRKLNEEEENHFEADSFIMTANESDNADQNRIIEMIQLETRFYEVFRLTAKYALSLFNQENRMRLKKIKNIIASTRSYNVNLQYIIYELQALLKKVFISFLKDDEEKLLTDPLQVQRCYGSSIDMPENNSCQLQNGKRLLILPEKYSYVYFGRLADELLRNSRIAEIILNRNRYLSSSLVVPTDNVPVFTMLNYGDEYELYKENDGVSSGISFVKNNTSFLTANPFRPKIKTIRRPLQSNTTQKRNRTKKR